jgi:chromosome segregation ATPase
METTAEKSWEKRNSALKIHYLCLIITCDNASMLNLSDKIKELENKLGRLTEIYDKLLIDQQVVKADNQRLTKIIHQLNEQIQQFEDKDRTNNTEITLNTEVTETIKTKQIIHEMMREIDQCLLLLDE